MTFSVADGRRKRIGDPKFDHHPRTLLDDAVDLVQVASGRRVVDLVGGTAGLATLRSPCKDSLCLRPFQRVPYPSNAN